jgi:hypothetical protein
MVFGMDEISNMRERTMFPSPLPSWADGDDRDELLDLKKDEHSDESSRRTVMVRDVYSNPLPCLTEYLRARPQIRRLITLSGPMSGANYEQKDSRYWP